ncbi:hypothetical protein L0244_15355, partial [bacterium]|nr:hypothetical protein [bacterium]
VGGASFLADASVAVIKALFKNADIVFKAVLNGLKLTDAFNVIIDFLRVTSHYVGSSIGDSLDEVIQFLSDLFTGGFQLWDNFVEFVKRVGAGTLLLMGFDEGSLLVGGIIRRGSSLSDEALRALDSVGDNLAKAGIKLSDEAADGLALAAKSLNSQELQIFTDTLRKNGPEHLETTLTAFKNFGTLTRAGAENIAQKLGGKNFAELMSKFASNPGDADQVFRILGNTNISKDALVIAMSQSPEAVHAFSFWKTDFLNSDLAIELAKRSGKDATVLARISELKNLTSLRSPEALAKISEIAANSIHGNGSRFVIGVWDETLEYSGGYVDYARRHGGLYYNSHQNVYNDLLSKFPKEEVDEYLWKVNQNVLSEPIANGVPFVYSMD